MKKTKTRSIPFRRKLKNKTNYRKRLRLLQSRKKRLVIRKSLKNILVQVVEFQPKGDKILVSAHSRELAKAGWKYSRSNTPAAYLVGFLLGNKLKKMNIQDVIVDSGQNKPPSRSKLYAVVKGVKESGVHIPVADDVLPDDKRVTGEHIQTYAQNLKANKEGYEKQFSGYTKNGANPEGIQKAFEDIKSKLAKA